MSGKPMDIDDELRSSAATIAKRLKQRIPRLVSEVENLEKKKTSISAEIESARRSQHLATEYSVYINERERRCPSCWVGEGITVIIEAIDGDRDIDRFRCSGCKAEFVGRS